MYDSLKDLIVDVPDFPKPGVLFRDIHPLLASPTALATVTGAFEEVWTGKVTHIAALDARGFIFGALLAQHMELPFVMIRKSGKLPGKTIQETYNLEYGTATVEVSEDAIPEDAQVLVIDDLLATGGTAAAACKLIEHAGGTVAGCAFVIELIDLNGRTPLADYQIQSLITY